MRYRFIIFSSCFVGLLSFLLGIIVGVSSGVLIFRTILSVLFIVLLEVGGMLVLKRFLPDIFISSVVPSGTYVDLVVGDEDPLSAGEILQDPEPIEPVISDFSDPEVDTAQASSDNKEGSLAVLRDSDPKSMARAIQTVLNREGST